MIGSNPISHQHRRRLDNNGSQIDAPLGDDSLLGSRTTTTKGGYRSSATTKSSSAQPSVVIPPKATIASITRFSFSNRGSSHRGSSHRGSKNKNNNNNLLSNHSISRISFHSHHDPEDDNGRRSKRTSCVLSPNLLGDDDDDINDEESGNNNHKTFQDQNTNKPITLSVRESMNNLLRQQELVDTSERMEQRPSAVLDILQKQFQKQQRKQSTSELLLLINDNNSDNNNNNTTPNNQDILQKQFQKQQRKQSNSLILLMNDDDDDDNNNIIGQRVSSHSNPKKNNNNTRRVSSRKSSATSKEKMQGKPEFISFEFDEETSHHFDENDDALLLPANYQPTESSKAIIVERKLFPTMKNSNSTTKADDDIISLPSFNTSQNDDSKNLFGDDDDDDDNSSYDYSSEEYDSDDDDDDNDDNDKDNAEIDPLRKKHQQVMNQYAKREQKNVQKWRVIVFILLVLIGSSVIAGTYIILKDVNYDTYIQSYTMHVHSIGDKSTNLMYQLLKSITDLSNDVTSAGLQQRMVSNNNNNNNDTSLSFFPYVRVPSFEVHGRSVRIQSGIEMFAWVPFVQNDKKQQWINYTNIEGPLWYEESKNLTFRAISEQMNSNFTGETLSEQYSDAVLLTLDTSNDTIRNFIWQGNPAEIALDANIYAPIFHMSPPPFSIHFLNYNMLKESSVANLLKVIPFVREGIFSPVDPTLVRLGSIAVSTQDHESFHERYVENDSGNPLSSFSRPHSVHVQPVFDDFYNNQSNIVGFLASVIAWDRYVGDLLPEGISGIYAVLKNNCGQTYTYKLVGGQAEYIGEGDFHETEYSNTEEVVLLTKYRHQETSDRAGHCVYSFYLYSSSEYEESINNNLAKEFTVGISIIFFVMGFSFCIYDKSVQKRNAKILNAAVRSNQIVSSIFPSHVTDKLLAEQDKRDTDTLSGMSQHMSRHARMKGDLLGLNSMCSTTRGGDDDDDDNASVLFQTRPPIADLFTDTTIMFADIAGFTAWSSSREPTQVFVLLETVYHAFDEIARKRRVFKVETVGDCYVAVCGLPDPRKDHAVTMCRFARDILFKMRELTQKLQRTLGPETEDLAMRVGLHSGPVTAGVLRGQNSRFQLFGDTMNTAARMEQNGVKDRIHISKETMTLVSEAGKSKWIIPREDKIVAKGKGTLDTYWLLLTVDGGRCGSVVSGGSSSNRHEKDFADSVASGMFGTKETRLIDWNVDVLVRLLKQIVARRKSCPPEPGAKPPDESRYTCSQSSTPFHEVCEIIEMPKFDEREMNQQDPASYDLDEAVKSQVHGFVTSIAATYRDNPFHSFEHASHVTQSVIKLLSRIVAPSYVDDQETTASGNDLETADKLHDHTYGITSDPLTQFACAFSSLIHDADHQGVPNAQLIKERTSASSYYAEKSVAEQNSVDLSWELLMQDEFKEFRGAIYGTDDELVRFRQLVVNCVMATDIVDKELKTLRNNRWEKAFSENEQRIESVATDRKATIVIEHLIQASDVSHTMQHWNIYRRWNEKFFVECYRAFLDGRAEKDPSDGWYQGELGFFDFYIIPLAKKLKDCGVFGVSSAEYLDYATKNRQEWEIKGEEVLHEMIEKAKKKLSPVQYIDVHDEMQVTMHMFKSH